MQILHPFTGSVQQYLDQLADSDIHRPAHCPQCQVKHPLTAHGFYTRAIADSAFDGVIGVRRYLCQACLRTVSLLPEFALRSSVAVIALFLVARLRHAKTLAAALQNAPFDDEPETELEMLAIDETRGWLKDNGGKGLPHAEAMRRLDLAY